MKNKFDISIWTWVFVAVAVISGLGKEIAFALIALLGHELAHLAVTYGQGRKVESLTIYPFGGVMRGTDPLALFSPEEIVIAFAGPMWNLFCTALGWLIAAKFPAWSQDIKLWWQINLWMAIINLLPLFPLDGGRMLAAVIYKFFGYRKGINIVSYATQAIAFLAVVGWLIYKPFLAEIHYLLLAAVIFMSAMKERQAAPFVLLRYLLKKNSYFNLKKSLPVKMLAVQEKSSLEDIVAEMKEDCFYILCAIGEDGRKRFVGEKSIIDTLMEKGGKTRINQIVEKDFT